MSPWQSWPMKAMKKWGIRPYSIACPCLGNLSKNIAPHLYSMTKIYCKEVLLILSFLIHFPWYIPYPIVFWSWGPGQMKTSFQLEGTIRSWAHWQRIWHILTKIYYNCAADILQRLDGSYTHEWALWLWVKIMSDPMWCRLVTPPWCKKTKKQIRIVHVMRGEGSFTILLV